MSFAWQAWHFVTFDVFQKKGVCATIGGLTLTCLWRKPQERVFLDVSEDVLMSFCMAGVALCDIRCVSGGMWVHDRRWTKVVVSVGEATLDVSEDVLMSFCVAEVALCDIRRV